MGFSNRFKYSFCSILLLIFGVTVFSFGQCNFTNGPIGEICKNAYYICGNQLDGYIGNLIVENSTDTIWPGETYPNQGVCNSGGTFNNSTWFSFTACASTVHIKIKYRSCVHPTGNMMETGIQSGLYTQCKKTSSVACDEEAGNTSGELDLKFDGFKPGELVFFVLDGYASSVCEFEIDVIEGIDTTPVLPPDPSLLDDGYITGPDTIECDGKNVPISYNLTLPECQIVNNSSCSSQTQFNPSDSVCFVWQISPLNGRYFENSDSVGRSVNIIFSEPGIYTISADSYMHPFFGGSCSNAACGEIISWQVNVERPDTLINPTEYFCFGENRVFCGQSIDSDSIIYCMTDACHVIIQEFKVSTVIVNHLGKQFLCSGGSFQFQGLNYNLPGSYDVPDLTDCTLMHRFEIEMIDISLQLNSGNTVLDCNNPLVTTITSASSNGPLSLDYIWLDQNNNILSSSQNVMINKAGRYVVQAIYDKGGIGCKNEQFIDITEDYSKPKVSAIIPTVKCLSSKDPKPVLTLATSDNITFSEWTLPLGGKSNGMNVVLDSANAVSGLPYLFSAIGVNGCKLDTSFIVNTNFEKAIVTLTGDDLTCYKPLDTLILKTNIAVDSIRWFKTTPQQAFYGSDPTKLSHPIDTGGTYKVEVMASSSKCWSDGTISIEDKIKYPSLSLQNGLKWHCNTKYIEVIPTVTSGQNMQFEWSTSDGKIDSDAQGMSLIAGSPGTYGLNVLDVDNGCQKSGALNIINETNVPERILLSVQDIKCFGESNGQITIEGVQGGFEPYTYYLNGVKTNNLIITDLPEGEFLLEVLDKYDCIAELKEKINEPPIFEISMPVDLTLAFSEITELTFSSNYPDDEIDNIKWLNSKGELLGSDFTLQYSSNKADIVSVEVTTINGCVSNSRIKIIIDTDFKIFFPNIFSPNGDGVNDRLVIFKNKIPAKIDRISIFDRYGNKVYSENSFNFGENMDGWDGTVNGKNAETGVYIFLIELVDYSGNKLLMKKDITLIR